MRLIDADALLKYIYIIGRPTYDHPYVGEAVVSVEDIENAPTIDPPEAKLLGEIQFHTCNTCDRKPSERFPGCPKWGEPVACRCPMWAGEGEDVPVFEQRRQGHWIAGECQPHFTCSCCGHWFSLYDTTNFCPNCGADMRAKSVPENTSI